MTCSRAQEPVTGLEVTPQDGRYAELALDVEGSGPDLLLIHGLSAHRGQWDALATDLVRQFRVLKPDLAGRGESPAASDDRFGLEDEVRRLAEMCAAYRVHRPLVVGHSHGAALALALAAHRRCKGLLLLNPVTPRTRRPAILGSLAWAPVRRLVAPVARHYRRPLARYILTRRVYADPRIVTTETVDRYAAGFASAERTDAMLRVLRDWRPAELGRIPKPAGIPLHVVTGALDRRAPPALARNWASELGAAFTVLEGLAHGLPDEAPARVVELIVQLERDSTA